MNNTWKDTTKRNRGDKDRVADNWDYKTSQLEILIMANHIYNPDRWTMHCKEVGFNAVDLRMDLDTPIKEVQQAALSKVKNRLESLLASLDAGS